MKINNLIPNCVILLTILSVNKINAQQAPVANFTVVPNPVCTGGTYTVTDLSTNNPTSWSYTIQTNPAPPPFGSTVFTTQNPTFAAQFPGVYTISLIATNSSGSSPRIVKSVTVVAGPNANINPTNPSSCIGGNPINIVVTTGGGPGGGGGITYNWSTGATTSSITVSPNATTIYSCVISSTNGCSVVRSTTVTISNPTVSIVSVPANICPGTTSTLTVSGSGPNPKTFTWSNNFTSNVITSSIAGVFSATMTNAQGCTGSFTYTLGTSTSLSLTAVSNPSAICSGNNAMLNVTGASTYAWSTGNNTQTITVSPTVTTTYSVTGQIGTCTGTTSITIPVSVLPTITINSSSNTICNGGTATLNANGAANYTWTPVNLFSSSIVVSPSTNVTYMASGVNPGCPARSASITINVSPNPNVSVASTSVLICRGEPIAISASSSSGTNTYNWSNGIQNSLILVTPTITTVFSVTATNQFNCSNTAAITITVGDCDYVGLNFYSQNNQLSIYPNPNSGSFVIKGISNSPAKIFNCKGQLVKEVSKEEMNNGTKIEGLQSGIYFIKWNNSTPSHKIIITE